MHPHLQGVGLSRLAAYSSTKRDSSQHAILTDSRITLSTQTHLPHSQSPPRNQLSFPRHRSFNDFTHLKVLGLGGFGLVAHVVHLLDGQHYALKIVPEHRTAQSEIEALSDLKGHPNVVSLISHWKQPFTEDLEHTLSKNEYLQHLTNIAEQSDSDSEDAESLDNEKLGQETYSDGISFMQMELCSGPTLKNFVANLERNMNSHDVVLLFWDLLRGLEHIHSKGIIHRKLLFQRSIVIQSC